MVSLRKKVSQAKTRYASRLETIQNEALVNDPNAKINLAVALYLATYFDANQSCRHYYNQNRCDKNFNSFFTEDYRKVPCDKEFIEKVQKSFGKFKKYSSDSRKLQKLLANKKLYSIPWLLCPESLSNQSEAEQNQHAAEQPCPDDDDDDAEYDEEEELEDDQE